MEAGMATKVTVTLVDDLDGSPAEETVRFGFGGTEYEIDLNRKNARAFRRQLAPFIEHARQTGRQPRRQAPRTASGSERSSAIRAWAKQQGIPVRDPRPHPRKRHRTV
jgi:hypothetical protein